MSPVATYHERRFEGKRRFQLFEDTIVVDGKDYFSNEFETTISLHAIDPNHGWLKTRTAGFWVTAPLTALISIPLYCLACALFDDSKYMLMSFIAAGLLAIYLTLGVIIRKIEFSSFQNEQGVIVLTIGRVGPDKKQYDEFVKLLTHQIKTVRGVPT